jgi:adenosylcobinamide-phosphate synthase
VGYAFHLPAKFILAAVVLDIVCGDLPWLPHPVSLIGRAITFGERRLYTGSPSRDLVGGTFLVIAVVMLAVGASWALIAALQAINWLLGALAATLIAWTTLAARGLNDAALAVERCLRCNDVGSARREIRALVGRDPDTLDQSGLVRAAIESVAENSSDGVIAPLLFLFIGGPVSALAYKAINTLDSMVGYRDARYLYFGRFAARLDDIANLVPARVTAVSIALATALLTGRARESLRACIADARKHESPNAGYPEAAMAGALGVELGGDAYYGGKLEHRPRFGRAEAPLNLAALRTSRVLMWLAAALVLAVCIVLRLMGAWVRER